jgi:hypothetical protein
VSNLFRFQTTTTCNVPTGSPKLVPVGGRITNNNRSQNFLNTDSIGSNASGLIDVVNDFNWTTSQRSSRQDIPSLILKEKKLKTNSLIAQLAYYSLIAAGQGGQVAGRLQNLFANSGSGIVNGLFNSIIGRTISGIGNRLVGAVSNFGSSILGTGAIEFFTGRNVNDFFGTFQGGSVTGGDVLAPYEGLYLTEDTGFVYRVPYFENMQNAVQNAFDNDDQILSKKGFGLGTLVGGAAQLAEAAVYSLATSLNIMEPGIYIEKPQFYRFGASGDPVTFSFPLINTGWSNFSDVQRNWQLIYMLIYQNRANRKTRDLIDPPCLYETIIPGIKYMPYSYISQLNVQFMGARRSYYINIPTTTNGGTTRIQTIIPDAYLVTVTLRSLVAETQNFLYSMLYNRQGVVNVIDSPSGVTSIVDNFLEGLRRETN